MRWLWSLALWSLLTTVTVATITVAGSDSSGPETFETAPSLPGDKATYKAALVVVDGEDATWTDLNARFAFERVDDRWVIADGRPRAVASFVQEWAVAPFEFAVFDFIDLQMPSCLNDLGGVPEPGSLPDSQGWDEDDWEAYGEAWEACGEAMEEWGEAYGEQWDDFDDRYGAWDDEQHTVAADAWHVGHHASDGRPVATSHRARDGPAVAAMAPQAPDDTVWTTDDETAGPCGFLHSLQGAATATADAIRVQGACPPAMDFGFAATEPVQAPLLRLAGTDTVGGRSTLVYAHEDPDLLRLWFADDVAYPVRMLSVLDVVPPAWMETTNDGAPPTFFLMLEMIDHAAGSASDLAPPPLLGPLTGTRQAWGPDDAGIDHPWPASLAVQKARAQPNSPLDDWLNAHPNAAADRVHFAAPSTWHMTWSDGVEHAQVTLRGAEQTVHEFIALERPSANSQPRSVPSIHSADVQAQTLTGAPTSGWSYTAACAASCADVDVWLTLGQQPAWGDDHTNLVVIKNGALVAHGQAPSPYPEPQISDGAWQPEEDAWMLRTSSTGTWSWPEPATAVAVTTATGLLSLLYLLWPTLKGAVPLFSRIRQEDLLDHPVRQGIVAAIETQPGIHFQELTRRMEKGRGTMEHHIRKLVAAGLLVEKSGTGFTCYFPLGSIDRHLMAVAPALKAPGARQLLQAIHDRPGAAAIELAGALDMAPSTINYHLRKLVDANLVATNRAGRSIALNATQLGDEALGTFTPT